MAAAVLSAGLFSSSVLAEDSPLFQDSDDMVQGTDGISISGAEDESAAQVLPPIDRANGDSLSQLISDLSQYDSTTGSDDEMSAAAYIEEKMKGFGYTVQEQAFHEGFVDESLKDEPGINIIAERGANSGAPAKPDIFLVVTHYDAKRSPEDGDPFANDKTGAAVLIEAARLLSTAQTDTDICFLFLSGEEDGLYGSRNFIQQLSQSSAANITGVLDVERVGYIPEEAEPSEIESESAAGDGSGQSAVNAAAEGTVSDIGSGADSAAAAVVIAGAGETAQTDTPDESGGGQLQESEGADGQEAVAAMPYILLTADGAGNTAAQLVQSAVEQVRSLAETSQTSAEDDIALFDGQDGDGALLTDGGEESSAGQTSEETAAQETAEDAAGMADGTGSLSTDASALMTPTEWSFLKDDTRSQAAFAEAGYPAVTVTQYVPGEKYEKESEGSTEGEQAQTGEPARLSASPDTDRLSEITDIIARAVYAVMDPET